MNFGDIKKESLWYIVGFIAADGCLSKDGRHVIITSKDRDHLVLIRDALNVNNIIGKKSRSTSKNKIYSHIQIGSVEFYKFLQKVGMTPAKSLTLGVLDIDDIYFKDFLRGVIDGDGCISTWIHKTNNHQQWSLKISSGSENFIKWLDLKIKIQLKISGRVYSRNEKNKQNYIYILKFGKKAAQTILSIIYYTGALSLKRKLIQAQLCLQPSLKMVNYTN